MNKLTDYHFKPVIIFNFGLFLFYTLFRILMALQLMVIEGMNFFQDTFHYHEVGYPHYTLFRVFAPVYFLIIFLVLYFSFFGKKHLIHFFRQVLVFERKNLLRYLAFVFLILIILKSPLLNRNRCNLMISLFDI